MSTQRTICRCFQSLHAEIHASRFPLPCFKKLGAVIHGGILSISGDMYVKTDQMWRERIKRRNPLNLGSKFVASYFLSRVTLILVAHPDQA